MPLNSYVTLGRSGLRVSPFCLGAMTFGEDLGVGAGASVTDSEAISFALPGRGWKLHRHGQCIHPRTLGKDHRGLLPAG